MADETTPASEAKGAAPPLNRPGGLAVFRVLRHREFAIFWVGLAVSMVGTTAV